jgi:UDP-2-acetamido-3-amino-2,3-dideoxy-glucuronate N-acetyltransferase
MKIEMAESYHHPLALVESDQVGEGTYVWAFAHVMPGARVGRNCNLAEHAFIETGAGVGDNVTIKNNVCLWRGVTLEDDVFVGPNATFTNDRFPRSARMLKSIRHCRHHEEWLESTVVERGASIGANATILPGIRVGRYSMVAAGALVTRDVPPFALMIGAPARRVDDVCRCGMKLPGNFLEAICRDCGETPQMRCLAHELEALTL